MEPEFYQLDLHDRLKKLVDEKYQSLGWGHRRQAALKMDFDPGYFSRMLNGHHEPNQETLRQFAENIGIPLGLILGTHVAVAGIVSAGGGIEEQPPTKEEPIAVGNMFVPGAVAYQVQGDSMRDASIEEHDFIIVRKKPDPAIGDIVVVYVPDIGTVVKLKQSNSSYASVNTERPRNPIERTPECREYGTLVGVVRKVPPDKPMKKRKSK